MDALTITDWIKIGAIITEAIMIGILIKYIWDIGKKP